MFDSHQKMTGIRCTMTVALLTVAFIFTPAVLAVSRSIGYVSVSVALACSALCMALAWRENYSQLTIPSIATGHPRRK